MGINSRFGALVWPIEEYRFNPGHCKQNAVILNLSTSILTDVTVSINLSFFWRGEGCISLFGLKFISMLCLFSCINQEFEYLRIFVWFCIPLDHRHIHYICYSEIRKLVLRRKVSMEKTGKWAGIQTLILLHKSCCDFEQHVHMHDFDVDIKRAKYLQQQWKFF